MRYFKTFVLSTLAFGLPISAQANGFDPRDNCLEILAAANENDRVMIAAWSYGFLSANQSDIRPVARENNAVLLRNLASACGANPSFSLLDVVRGSKKNDAAKTDAGQTEDLAGTESHVRDVLMRFYAPDADLVALTAALRPSQADIRAVYGDPLATKMVAGYDALFRPGTKFGPKSTHTDVLIVYTTTASLRSGDAALRDFPGGYKDVTRYFVGDFPIVRFKFVASGETLGLAFDGLVFVNNHWVLMPKPWRYLD